MRRKDLKSPYDLARGARSKSLLVKWFSLEVGMFKVIVS